MVHLLLVLVLFSPNDHVLGERVATQVETSLGTAGKVLTGAAAASELETHGIKESDFQVSTGIGEQLTKQLPNVIVVRVEARKSGGDDLIESQVWAHGHVEKHVAIAGGGHDVIEGAVRGVLSMVTPQLPDPDAGASADEAHLPQLATAEHWQQILDQVAPYGPPRAHQSARALYYEVMAYCRLNRVAAAIDALGRMQRQWPSHVLTAAAANLLPEAPEPKSSETAPAGTLPANGP